LSFAFGTWTFVYNTAVKAVYISGTSLLIYLMRCHPSISETYDMQRDSFPHLRCLLLPALLLGFITAEEWTIVEVLWTASIWLESVSVLPQLFLLQQLRKVDSLTAAFLATRGAWRFFYILNWIYRYFAEHYVNPIGWVGGIVQTGLYIFVFYRLRSHRWCTESSTTATGQRPSHSSHRQVRVEVPAPECPPLLQAHLSAGERQPAVLCQPPSGLQTTGENAAVLV